MSSIFQVIPPKILKRFKYLIFTISLEKYPLYQTYPQCFISKYKIEYSVTQPKFCKLKETEGTLETKGKFGV